MTKPVSTRGAVQRFVLRGSKGPIFEALVPKIIPLLVCGTNRNHNCWVLAPSGLFSPDSLTFLVPTCRSLFVEHPSPQSGRCAWHTSSMPTPFVQVHFIAALSKLNLPKATVRIMQYVWMIPYSRFHPVTFWHMFCRGFDQILGFVGLRVRGLGLRDKVQRSMVDAEGFSQRFKHVSWHTALQMAPVHIASGPNWEHD